MYSFGTEKLPSLTSQSFLPEDFCYYSPKTMTNDKVRIFCICVMGLCFTACSPQYRLQRLLQNNPYLYEIFTHDSVRVQNVMVSDSVFFFTKEKDTIRFENATIFRHSDTLRLVQSCPPCTTFYTKTILQPTQKLVKEKGRERTLREKLEDAIFPLIVGILLAIIFRRK